MLSVGDVSKLVVGARHSASEAGTSQQDQPRPAVVGQDRHSQCFRYVRAAARSLTLNLANFSKVAK